MIAFDTNHLLRHILQDDAKQCQRVRQLIEEQSEVGRQVLIVDLVIMETCWVLTKVYKFDRSAWCSVLEALMSDSAFSFEDVGKLRRSLNQYMSGSADFNDYLILNQAKSLGARLETFDKKLKPAT